MLKNKALNLFKSISIQHFGLLKRKVSYDFPIKNFVESAASSRRRRYGCSLYSSTLSYSSLLLLFLEFHHQSFSLLSEKYLNFTFALLALSTILSFPNFSPRKSFKIFRRILKIMLLCNLEYSRFREYYIKCSQNTL